MLHIHRAERADRLVEALADVLAEPLDDPFATEVVAVPSRGVERWLTQRLSGVLGAASGRADGVCANVDFPLPGSVVGRALAAATGVDLATDPWRPERAVWPLLEVVEAHRGAPWLGALGGYLAAADQAEGNAGAGRGGRRLGAVRRIAGRYDRYGLQRPALLRAWAEGRDTTGDGVPLPPDVAWQAPLWRALRAHLGVPSPAERLDGGCARLVADPAVTDLPPRLLLFGITRLPAAHRQALQALAAGREVHLLLLHPSPALWTGIAAGGDAAGAVRRSEDLTVGTPVNPLLATWGRDARELQLILADVPHRDHHHALAGGATSLLGLLQDDVRADRAPVGPPHPGTADRRPALASDDRSVQVHACHGRARQVEVVRDAILHLLADDETLEPRDVVVMCPDVEAYAPLIHAAFGATDLLGEEDSGPEAPGGRPDLQVQLADRSLRQTNPLLAAVAALLDLAPSRVTASQVLDLAGRDPIRRRFDLDDDDLARIEGWVAATGVRWGLDGEHRAAWRIGLDDGTWRRGLDRILLGVAMAEDALPLVAGVLPLDDVATGDIALVGRLAELLARLEVVLGDLAIAQPLGAWVAALHRAADALLAGAPDAAWQEAELDGLLADLLDEAVPGEPAGLGAEGTGGRGTADAAGPVLDPAELRDLLGARLRGRPTRAGFRTGHLTVCTLVPMRSVPHRVVCLLGLDDGRFPRAVAPDGDDVLVRTPHVGDHDHRSEDRQLLLDALLAAGEHLLITYAGRDERTNASLPPAVPVGELLDAIDATVRVDGDATTTARERVVVHHPLQPFDPRNFTAGALVGTGPWGFEPSALDGARALVGTREPQPPFLADPLPFLRGADGVGAADGGPAGHGGEDGDLVELDALVRFVGDPVGAFLRQRLGVTLERIEEDPDDALSLDLDELEHWDVGQRLLEARMAGATPTACRAAELARGMLPPGQLAVPVLDAIGATVERLVTAAAAVPAIDIDRPAPEPLDVHVPLPDGRLLMGTVTDRVGDGLLSVRYARLGPAHRLASWVRLLAATLTDPERDWEAVTIGRAATGDGVATARVRLHGDPAARRQQALTQLTEVVDLHDRGLREPLPLPPRSAAAYVRAVAAGDDVVAAVREIWESSWQRPGEHAAPAHRLVGLGSTLDELTSARPREDEAGEDWDPAPSRFGRLSQRLWRGLLDHEELTGR